MFICRELLYVFNFFGNYSFCNNALTCVNRVMTNAVMSMYHFMCKWATLTSGVSSNAWNIHIDLVDWLGKLSTGST